MRISDWSSDVCSSDLFEVHDRLKRKVEAVARDYRLEGGDAVLRFHHLLVEGNGEAGGTEIGAAPARHIVDGLDQRLVGVLAGTVVGRSGDGCPLDLQDDAGGREGWGEFGKMAAALGTCRDTGAMPTPETTP